VVSEVSLSGGCFLFFRKFHRLKKSCGELNIVVSLLKHLLDILEAELFVSELLLKVHGSLVELGLSNRKFGFH